MAIWSSLSFVGGYDFLKDLSLCFFFFLLKIGCLQRKWRISEKFRLCLVLCQKLMLKMNIKDRLQKLFPQNLFEDRDFFLSFCFLDCIWFIFYFFLFFCCFHFCGFWEVHNRSFFVAKSKLFLFSNLIPELLQEQTLSLIWLVKPKKKNGWNCSVEKSTATICKSSTTMASTDVINSTLHYYWRCIPINHRHFFKFVSLTSCSVSSWLAWQVWRIDPEIILAQFTCYKDEKQSVEAFKFVLGKFIYDIVRKQVMKVEGEIPFFFGSLP